MMDEAFMPFQKIIEQMLSFAGEFVDDQMGVRSYIYECEIESPVELDVCRDDKGSLRIGSTPPIYYIDTSIRPSFHRLRFTAHLDEKSDGD